MKSIIIPADYDYVGVYLTDKCHLSCAYCITQHHKASYGRQELALLTAAEWIQGLNRLQLPCDVPITLQGGEPFLYKGIWDILEGVKQKIDILTALPDFLTKDHFMALNTLNWNLRDAPYPTIRVSFHKGQNDYKSLIERIADLQEVISIGLFYLNHPGYDEGEINNLKAYADKYKVDIREKEFLGVWEGKRHGNLMYEDAACGKRVGKKVKCKNTVVPISPDGTMYRCHSDLYFKRRDLSLGNILDREVIFEDKHLPCDNYGLCSECDVKIKNNHLQQFGYTSVDIRFEEVCHRDTKTQSITNE